MIDTVLHGDALEELRKLPDNSIDALCVDPPSSIHFMGKSWDSDKGGRKQWIAWLCSIMIEVYRVLKPGAHGLVWALPRTSHWTGTALEDAGFEIRDSIYHLYSKHDKLQSFMATLNDEQRAVFEQLMEDDNIKLHIFGSGFPKSLSVDKAIDAYFGKSAEREKLDLSPNRRPGHENGKSWKQSSPNSMDYHITAPATPLAQQWAGWGSAMKPAVECWWLIRKPLGESSIAKNVLEHGTGALNIDACRIGTEQVEAGRAGRTTDGGYHKNFGSEPRPMSTGRWPANTLLTHTLLCTDEQCAEYCPVALLDEQSGMSKSTDRERHNNAHTPNAYSAFNNPRVTRGHNDQGGASRYFKQLRPDAPFIYAPKASRRERNAGCEALPVNDNESHNLIASKWIIDPRHKDGGYAMNPSPPLQNNHPCVKSLSLMKYLLRLITPPNGIVLDCFAGSGSTLCAAISEGFHYVGIEAEAEYIEIINARLAHARKEVHGALFACGD